MSETNTIQSTNKRSKIKKIALYGILSAIIIIMSFTPLGFLKIPALAIEITLLSIPVAIGAALLGPAGGLVCGTLFGLMSFVQCFGFSPLGATMLSQNPVFAFIQCVIPRALMGLFCALIFKWLTKYDKKRIVSFVVSSFSAAFLNTLFFMLCLWALFPEIFYTLFFAVVSINGLLEIIVCTAVGFAVSKALSYFLFKERN